MSRTSGRSRGSAGSATASDIGQQVKESFGTAATPSRVRTPRHHPIEERARERMEHPGRQLAAQLAGDTATPRARRRASEGSGQGYGSEYADDGLHRDNAGGMDGWRGGSGAGGEGETQHNGSGSSGLGASFEREAKALVPQLGDAPRNIRSRSSGVRSSAGSFSSGSRPGADMHEPDKSGPFRRSVHFERDPGASHGGAL